MNIDISIVCTVVGIFGTGILAAIAFVYNKLCSLEVRIVRIETRIGCGERKTES
jgi:hypothetical protein